MFRAGCHDGSVKNRLKPTDLSTGIDSTIRNPTINRTIAPAMAVKTRSVQIRIASFLDRDKEQLLDAFIGFFGRAEIEERLFDASGFFEFCHEIQFAHERERMRFHVCH